MKNFELTESNISLMSFALDHFIEREEIFIDGEPHSKYKTVASFCKNKLITSLEQDVNLTKIEFYILLISLSLLRDDTFGTPPEVDKSRSGKVQREAKEHLKNLSMLITSIEDLLDTGVEGL